MFVLANQSLAGYDVGVTETCIVFTVDLTMCMRLLDSVSHCRSLMQEYLNELIIIYVCHHCQLPLLNKTLMVYLFYRCTGDRGFLSIV